MKIIYSLTKNGLKLPGFEYQADNKNICCLFVHGMAETILDSFFAQVLGDVLSRNGINFLYSHNTGYGHINDIRTTKINDAKGYETQRIGVVYERFEQCLLDIDSWMDVVRNRGYQKIILIGHSMGCNKVLYHYHRKRPEDVIGISLISPPDMVGMFKLEQYVPNYAELVSEARENIRNNNPEKILSSKIWGYHYLSSQTFLDIAIDGCPADNLPLLRNPQDFEELKNIEIPISAILGEYDDIAIRTLQEDLDLMETKAKNCKSFTKAIIKNANHNYELVPNDLANVVLDRINQIKS